MNSAIVTLRNIYTGGEQEVGPFDEIVVASGSQPYNPLAAALAGKVDELHAIGAS